MSRIYKSEQAGVRYEGATQSRGFNPVVAVSSDREVREWGAARVQDAQTIGREITRQMEMERSSMIAQQQADQGAQRLQQFGESALLAGNQLTERGRLDQSQLFQSSRFKQKAEYLSAITNLQGAHLSATASVQNANTQAISTAIQGLLSFSGSYLKFREGQILEEKKQNQIRQLNESIGLGADFFKGKDSVPPEAYEQRKINTEIMKAETTAINNVAAPLEQSQDPVDINTATQLKQSTTWKQTEGVRGNVYAARAMFASALEEARASGQIRPGAEGYSDGIKFIQEFAKATGLLYADPADVAEVFSPTALGLLQNTVASVTKEHRDSIIQANQVTLKGRLSDMADGATTESIGALFTKGVDDVLNSNVGISDKKAATTLALGEFLANLAEEGKSSEIERLRSHVYNESSGRTLGQDFDHLFDKASNISIDRKIELYQRKERIESIEFNQSLEFFYDDPSPENRKKAVQMLQAIGSEKALKLAQELTVNGLDYDPRIALDIARIKSEKGILPSAKEIDNLAREGRISQEEHKFLKAQTQEAIVDGKLKPVLDTLKSDLRKGMTSGKDLSPLAMAQVGQRVDAAYEEIKTNLALLISNNPRLSEDPAALRQETADVTSKVLSRPEYQAKFGSDGSVSFTQPLTFGKIPQVAPGKEDYTSVNPERLFQGSGTGYYIPRSMMQPDKDIFISPSTLKGDIRAIEQGKVNEISNRSRLIARNLNLTPRAFIDAQMRAHGLPSLNSYLETGGARMVPDQPTGGSFTSAIGREKTVQIGRHLLNKGFTIWQHPNFDIDKGFVPQGGARVWKRPYDSAHNNNRALDFPLSHNSESRLNWLANYLRANQKRFGIRQILWKTPGHEDHLHVDFN